VVGGATETKGPDVMRVLVVDDDPSIRSMLEYALGFEGYEVVTAPDGANAIALAHSHRPDAIVLDVMMPRMNGYDVAERLRSDADLAELPIIMVTARTGDEDVLDGWRAGVDSYLTKPLDLTLLFTELHRVMSGKMAEVA
jgi:DNA-binding response OmpR family regulator